MAAASMKRDGNVTETAARAMVTAPSSSGWLRNNLLFDLFACELLSDPINIRKQMGTKRELRDERFAREYVIDLNGEQAAAMHRNQRRLRRLDC
jgi:hypothetical protein